MAKAKPTPIMKIITNTMGKRKKRAYPKAKIDLTMQRYKESRYKEAVFPPKPLPEEMELPQW